MIKSITPNIMVENVDETVKFYKAILCFEVVDKVCAPDGQMMFAIVQADGIMLMFQRKDSLVEEYPMMAIEAIRSSLTLFLKVDNLESVYAKLYEKVKVIAELHDTFYGSKEFSILDNNGSVLTISNIVKG